MPHRLIAAAAALLCSGCLAAADKPADFDGTWEGTFKGAVFCVLRINILQGQINRSRHDSITGTLSPGNISVDEQGDLTDATPSTSGEASPISNAKVSGRTLAFDWKDSGGEPVMKLELILTGDNQGELKFVSEDHKIKPLHLRLAQ